MHGTFTNRKEGGQLLSGLLASRGYARPVVLALSSGGVSVGYEIARALEASLGLLSVAALGEEEPARRWSPQLARRALDPALGPAGRGAPASAIIGDGAEGRSSCLHRAEGAPLEVAGHTMILVDDWIESGGPVSSVLPDLRRRSPRRIVLATPVALLDACPELERECDEVFCLTRPARGAALADCYAALESVTDASVIALLDRSGRA